MSDLLDRIDVKLAKIKELRKKADSITPQDLYNMEVAEEMD